MRGMAVTAATSSRNSGAITWRVGKMALW